MKRLVTLFFSVLVFTIEARAGAYTLLNIGRDFKTYVNRYRNSEIQQQWFGWKEFEKQHQKYFNAALCDSSEDQCEATKKARLHEFFSQLPNFETSMWSIFDNAELLAATQIEQFKRYFPDTPANVPIVFMPSLLMFNGKGSVKIDGNYTLIIGADLAALRKNNMSVLFSHELFHNYQFNKLKSSAIYQTFASPLWFEGLAVWASSLVNPLASDAEILMNPDLAEFCATNENISKLAKAYTSLLATSYTDPKAAKTEADWFYASGDDLPHRRGYCLGLKVVREINKSIPVNSIIAEDETKFSRLVGDSLARLGAF
jgi:uncharacterized protein YjaZ